jgi:hypothetical protein
LNRTGAACGLPTTLRAAQDFVSQYALNPRHAQLSQEIALDLKMAFRPTIQSFEGVMSLRGSRLLQRG